MRMMTTVSGARLTLFDTPCGVTIYNRDTSKACTHIAIFMDPPVQFIIYSYTWLFLKAKLCYKQRIVAMLSVHYGVVITLCITHAYKMREYTLTIQ